MNGAQDATHEEPEMTANRHPSSLPLDTFTASTEATLAEIDRLTAARDAAGREAALDSIQAERTEDGDAVVVTWPVDAHVLGLTGREYRDAEFTADVRFDRATGALTAWGFVGEPFDWDADGECTDDDLQAHVALEHEIAVLLPVLRAGAGVVHRPTPAIPAMPAPVPAVGDAARVVTPRGAERRLTFEAVAADGFALRDADGRRYVVAEGGLVRPAQGGRSIGRLLKQTREQYLAQRAGEWAPFAALVEADEIGRGLRPPGPLVHPGLPGLGVVETADAVADRALARMERNRAAGRHDLVDIDMETLGNVRGAA